MKKLLKVFQLKDMSKKVRLSIVIVNFNTYKFLCQCLDSIYSIKEDFEIIVVDNASSDDSVSLIRQHYPKVLVISNNKNIGFATANNQGVKKAKGDYILLLNPDTLIPKNTLSRMLKFMEENPMVGMTTCKVILPTDILDDACHRGFPTPWNAFCQFSGLSYLFPKSLLFNGYHLGYRNMDRVHEIDSCAGAFMLIRREAGEKIGWFDEDFFWYGEDLDFCFRVKKSGWKVMYIPDVKIIHYKGVASGIKKHSRGISSASKKTRLIATQARFEVMRVFYNKHYREKYPGWLTSLVLSGIKLKEWLGLRSSK